MPVPENVTTAQTEAQNAEATSAGYVSGQFQVGDILKQKTLDYLNNNQDIIGKLDTAQAQYIGAPSAAREMYLTQGSPSQLRDPFAAEKLVSQYVAEKSIPMLALSSILGQRFGRIEDTIGAGTRAYQAQGAMALANAQAKRQTATDAFNAWLQGEELRLKEAQINKPSAGSSKSALELAIEKKILDAINGGGQPTEPEPQYSPSGGYGTTSPGGEWIFSANGWVPASSIDFIG
jgi:hypothetical protein